MEEIVAIEASTSPHHEGRNLGKMRSVLRTKARLPLQVGLLPMSLGERQPVRGEKNGELVSNNKEVISEVHDEEFKEGGHQQCQALGNSTLGLGWTREN